MSSSEGPEPIWNPDAHLEGVYRRGRGLRNRRRFGLLAGTGVAAVLLVAGAAAAVSGQSHPGQRVATASSSRAARVTTTIVASDGAGATTSTTALGPAITASGGAGTVPGSSASGATTTVTRRPAAVTTTATTTAPGAACASSELAYATVTEHTNYTVGQAVVVNLRVTNMSGRTCTGPSTAGIGASATITDGGGGQVTQSRGPAIACMLPCTPPVLAPGATASYSAGEWGSAGPAGTYHAVAQRLGHTGTAATFTVG